MEIVERVYVPVARFAALQEEISAADLLALWMGTPDGGQQPLVVDADTAAALTLLWGPAGTGGGLARLGRGRGSAGGEP